MALEPIFEIEFHDSSYGFRPNRSAHQAVSSAAMRLSAIAGSSKATSRLALTKSRTRRSYDASRKR